MGWIQKEEQERKRLLIERILENLTKPDRSWFGRVYNEYDLCCKMRSKLDKFDKMFFVIRQKSSIEPTANFPVTTLDCLALNACVLLISMAQKETNSVLYYRVEKPSNAQQ